MDMESKFKLFSICLVATDLEEDGKVIECYPLEHATYAEDDKDHVVFKDIKRDINWKETIPIINVEDIDTDKYTVILNRKKTIKATWLPFGDSNRVTAPMIKRGETVRVYRYANTDDFYWQTLYNEFDLRRLEKVKHYYSNTQVLDEMLNDDNTYWTLIDTINKNLHLHTSDNDGEHTTYDLDIDTKVGVVELYDGKGNYIKLNSSTDTIDVFTNKTINLTSETINFKANKLLTIDAPSWKTKTSKTEHTIEKVDYVGGVIKHDDISIDEYHTHVGDLGFDVSTPNN